MAKRPPLRQAASRRPTQRKALLVGINHYPGSPLKGCVNDALMVSNLLIEQFGFEPGGDMRLLVDERATKAAILERLRWLVDGARPGDILVFHYSGHGAQVPDRLGDEVDRVDECLCPFDFTFDNPLLDDDLSKILEQVPAEVNLTCLLDCCHSGTGTRDLGPLMPFPSRDKRLLPPPDIAFRRVSRVEFNPGWGNRSVTMTDFRDLDLRRIGSGAAEQNAVVIAGCRADQLSKDAFIEGDFHGALTFGLYKALQDGGIDQSYAHWVEAGAAQLKGFGIREQDPQLEGPVASQQWRLFSTEPTRRAARARDVRAKHVVYVHGIGQHDPDFSDPWFEAMRAFTPSLTDANRHEVLWSDIVNPRSRAGARAVRMPSAGGEDLRRILMDTLEDRAERALVQENARRFGPTPRNLVAGTRGLGLPSVDGIDDFVRYLLDSNVRQQVLARFDDVVVALLEQGHEVEVISHSWGTVVAYEALRRMDETTFPGRVHNLFSVGSALSFRAVQFLLIDEASDGARPSVVGHWANLDAENDIVGGSLASRFAVDQEFLELRAVGCDSSTDFSCAHSSYFHPENTAVNRDILARLIEREE